MRIAGAAAGILFVILLEPAPARARGCHEVSDIVGRQRCGRFGVWSVARVPPIVIELAFSGRDLPLARETFAGRMSFLGGDQHPLRIPGDALGRARTYEAHLRATAFPLRALYLGAELQFGGASLVPTRFDGGALPESALTAAGTDGGPLPAVGSPTSLTSDRIQTVGGGGLIGVAVPLGPLLLRAEVLLGGRVLDLRGDSPDAPLIPRPPSQNGHRYDLLLYAPSFDDVREWIVEPRASASVFLTPWFSIGATLGVDALRGGALSLMTGMQFHTRAYDSFHRP